MSSGSLNIDSILITGADRGIGLEFVKQLTQLPQSPKHIFATCLNSSGTEVSGTRGCFWQSLKSGCHIHNGT